jgi:putative transposase
MTYPTDMTDAQWAKLKPLLESPSKRGRKHGHDLRQVVDALLYVTHTGCQWRYLPESYGPWTRVWSQFRRWSSNVTMQAVVAGLHPEVRALQGRSEPHPSLIVIDTHLVRGSSNGGATFHDQGGPLGWTNGAKRVVAVDVTGLPLAVKVVPASTTEADSVGQILAQIEFQKQTERLEVVLVDKGVPKKQVLEMNASSDYEIRRYGWDKQPVDTTTGKKVFKPLKYAWKVEAAHAKMMNSRRLSKSFENTTESATAWANLAAIQILLRELR